MIILLDEKVKYYVVIGSRGLFAYENGDITTTDNPRSAYGHNTLSGAIKAQRRASVKFGQSHIVKGRLLLEETATVSQFHIEDFSVAEILSKLESWEAEALKRWFTKETNSKLED